MKELSIEQKAKAYDKKVSQAKEMLKDGTISQNTINYIQHLFPELIESEDKKWRSWLIGHLEGYKNATTPQYSAACDEAIAWLEKQAKLVDEGEQKSAKNIVETWKDMRLEVYQQASGNRHEPNYSDNTTKMFSLNDIDEIIEKMSEQKSMDKNEPKFHKGEWLQYRNAKPFFVEEITEQGYVNGISCLPFDWENEIHLWTIQDAKDGDVLLSSDGSIFIFKEVVDFGCKHYIALATDGTIRVNDNFTHFWESVSGVCPTTKEQRDTLMKAMTNAGYTFDFEKKELKKIEDKPLVIDEGKDEIDKSFTKMMLKDYTKQNPVWSEEDEKEFEKIIGHFDWYSNNGFSHSDCDRAQNWLKSLKQRIGG